MAPKDRLLQHGAQGLSDAELLAVVLRNGSPGIPALTTAERLLRAAGGLGNLLVSDREDLRSYGVTDSRASILLAAGELFRRLTPERVARQKLLDRPDAVAAYLGLRFPVNGQEALGALYLNCQQRLLEEREIFRGGLTRMLVEPRPILVDTLRHRASNLILWHSHPSGDPEPSESDLAFTRPMVEAGRLLGIRMLDHMILGSRGRWVSLSRRGACC